MRMFFFKFSFSFPSLYQHIRIPWDAEEDIPQGYHNVIFVALYGWNSKLTYWRCNTDKVKSTRNLMGVS